RTERPRPQPLRAYPGRFAVGPLRRPPPGPGPPVRLRQPRLPPGNLRRAPGGDRPGRRPPHRAPARAADGCRPGPRWRERADAAAEAGVARRRATYEQARALRANGACVAQIARTVGISRMTVYKYLREGPPQRKRHSIHGKQRVLEPYGPYL